MKKIWFWIIGIVLLLGIVFIVELAPFFALGGFETPNTCSTPEPYSCLDFDVSGSTAQFVILGSGIDKTPAAPPNNKVVSIAVNGQSCDNIVNDDLTLSEESAQTVSCTLHPVLSKGDTFEGTISLQYMKKGESKAYLGTGEFKGTVK